MLRNCRNKLEGIGDQLISNLEEILERKPQKLNGYNSRLTSRPSRFLFHLNAPTLDFIGEAEIDVQTIRIVVILRMSFLDYSLEISSLISKLPTSNLNPGYVMWWGVSPLEHIQILWRSNCWIYWFKGFSDYCSPSWIWFSNLWHFHKYLEVQEYFDNLPFSKYFIITF